MTRTRTLLVSLSMYLRIEYGCGAYGGCKVIQRPFPLLGSRNLTKNVSLRTGVKLANGAP